MGDQQKKLLEAIENKRQVLIHTAAKEGLSSPTAVRYSQELDDLLNEFEKTHAYKSAAFELPAK
ncbi:hypothetical protein KP77_19510 [Jeotgalibacillus alimentarius]|uniref:Aspartyl-phosphate phosphatase Spo0E family protein n=1 Tax=Jeotgalibacillus alimentarius TaxID=135826 RepID=A0A0C2W1T7_9BACL|nr:aspartyl-phosphate phosphatase Spo0E family protein [Jeotgalibacillus alimentarius]KIL50576.1 hypothetical protein KP77_19510 [Jeotgalibacillus alimentarius]